MGKLPYFPFYPDDWLSNMKLQSCSMTSQGLLIYLMCIMHQSTVYGKLLINGTKPDLFTIKTLTKMNLKSLKFSLNELLKFGVLYEEDGVLCCRRMIADHRLREIRREAGMKGGNPNLVNQEVKQEDNLIPVMSVSVPVSVPTTEEEPKKKNTSCRKLKFDDGDSALAELLGQLMYGNNPEMKPITEEQKNKWANVFRMMREIDKRTPERIEEVLRWSQQDSFWKGNILSADKLRKQFDTLVLRMNNGRQEQPQQPIRKWNV